MYMIINSVYIFLETLKTLRDENTKRVCENITRGTAHTWILSFIYTILLSFKLTVEKTGQECYSV